MYIVKVVEVNEAIEVEIDATYCIVDDKNCLVLINKLDRITEPVARFPAGRWVYAIKG